MHLVRAYSMLFSILVLIKAKTFRAYLHKLHATWAETTFYTGCRDSISLLPFFLFTLTHPPTCCLHFIWQETKQWGMKGSIQTTLGRSRLRAGLSALSLTKSWTISPKSLHCFLCKMEMKNIYFPRIIMRINDTINLNPPDW